MPRYDERQITRAGLEDQLVDLRASGIGAGHVDGDDLPFGRMDGADPLALEVDRDGLLAAAAGKGQR